MNAHLNIALLESSPVLQRQIELALDALPLNIIARAKTIPELGHLYSLAGFDLILTALSQEVLLNNNHALSAIPLIFYDPGEKMLQTREVFTSFVMSQISSLFSEPHDWTSVLVSADDLFPPKAIFLGLSSGGPRALEFILARLDLNPSCMYVIAQQMPHGQTQVLADFFKNQGLPVSQLEHLEVLRGGRIYLLPSGVQSYAGQHPGGGVCFVHSQLPKNALFTPNIDSALLSLARIYGPRLCASILTGMGNDGAKALRFARILGAQTFAEHESSARVNGMPKAAILSGGAQKVLDLKDFPEQINRWVWLKENSKRVQFDSVLSRS